MPKTNFDALRIVESKDFPIFAPAKPMATELVEVEKTASPEKAHSSLCS